MYFLSTEIRSNCFTFQLCRHYTILEYNLILTTGFVCLSVMDGIAQGLYIVLTLKDGSESVQILPDDYINNFRFRQFGRC